MGVNVAYHSDQNIFFRFRDHAKLGLASDLGEERPLANLCEKAGDVILNVVSLPYRGIGVLAKKAQDPRVATIALTALALVASTFVFFPVTSFNATVIAAKFTFHLIAKIPFIYVKFAAYIATCSGILGLGLRAEGRFSNTQLMNQFYGTQNVNGNPARLTHRELLTYKV